MLPCWLVISVTFMPLETVRYISSSPATLSSLSMRRERPSNLLRFGKTIVRTPQAASAWDLKKAKKAYCLGSRSYASSAQINALLKADVLSESVSESIKLRSEIISEPTFPQVAKQVVKSVAKVAKELCLLSEGPLMMAASVPGAGFSIGRTLLSELAALKGSISSRVNFDTIIRYCLEESIT